MAGRDDAQRRTRTRMAPEARRRQFIALGLEHLDTHTLDHMSMDAIAHEAGVSSGLMFHYFESKAEFQGALVDELARRVREASTPRTAPRSLDEVGPVVGETVRTYVDHIVENRRVLLPILSGVGWSDPTVRDSVRRVREEIAQQMLVYAEGLGMHRTPGMELAVHGWIAAVGETLSQWLDSGSRLSALPRETVVEHLVSMFGGMLASVGVRLPRGDRSESGDGVDAGSSAGEPEPHDGPGTMECVGRGQALPVAAGLAGSPDHCDHDPG